MSATVTDTDLQLLTRYARGHAEDAFAEIVRRHLDLVHSAALRQVRSPQLAEEVAQSAFTDLAHNAVKLTNATGGSPVLTAWLYQVTRRTAIDVVRREARRQLREQIATEMNAMNASGTGVSPVWSEIEPLLDEAMSALDDTDRAAVLLRYFENKSLREVGQQLGTSDDAAQKRVSRAVERLREFFTKRGVATGASGLVVVISANAVQAAPVGLAVTISTVAALAGTAIVAGSTVAAKTSLTTMNIVNAKTISAIVASGLIAGTGTYLVQHREANRLHSENERLGAAQQKLVEEHDTALSASKANLDALERARRERIELLRLRGEIGVLRSQLSELEKLRAENQHLRELRSTPAGNATTPESDPEFAQRSQRGRDAKILAGALLGYALDHAHQYPTNFDQVAPYLGEWLRNDLNPGDVLRDVADFVQVTNQFEIVYQGKRDTLANLGETIVLREKQPWHNGGKLRKTYAFADGRSEVMVEPPEGFEAWEKRHMLVPLKNP